MTLYKGNCFCGQVSFELKSEPASQFVCYCTDCQHWNSGGRLCGALFDKTSIEVTGQTSQYNYSGGSGKMITLHFCPKCGTQLFHFPEKYPDYVAVQVSLLKGFAYQPTFENFPRSIAAWDKPHKISD